MKKNASALHDEGQKKKKIIAVFVVAAVGVVGIGAALHVFRHSSPKPVMSVHISTIPARERAKLKRVSHKTTAPLNTPATAPVTPVPVAASTPVTPGSVAASTPVTPVVTPASPLGTVSTATPVTPATRIIAKTVATQPQALLYENNAAMRYENSQYYGQEAALQRKIRILTLVKKIAKLQKTIQKTEDSSGSMTATLPPPVTTKARHESVAKVIAQTIVSRTPSQANANRPVLIAVLSTNGKRRAVIQIGKASYNVSQGQFAGKWRVRGLSERGAVLVTHGKTLRISN